MSFDSQTVATKAAGVSDRRKIQRVTPRLLEWYSIHARDLPWRHTRDPYAIWISEIMLQQTQVTTVIPYWERWMKILPNVVKLARARPEKILKLWEGLGYYSRARNLQKAALKIVEKHGGNFPSDPETLNALPGIGRYTAGAICSIAFDLPEPILDGNVTRVLARLFAIEDEVSSAAANRNLWALAQRFVNATDKCGSLNQALMEIGATICKPRQPSCGECPLKRSCAAKKLNSIEAFPNKPKPRASKECHWRVLVLNHSGRYLIRQRPTGGINEGLWEFPTEESISQQSPREWQTELVGCEVGHPRRFTKLSHTITDKRIRIEVWLAKTNGHKPVGKWVKWSQLRKLPLAGAHLKILALMNEEIADKARVC